MIKVRAGQVWNANGLSLNVKHVDSNTVRFNSGDLYSLIHVQTVFIFEPQNDLEWLAVNEPEWCDRKQFNFIRKGELFGAVYHVDNNHQFRWYSRNEWQNMRYHLGLDEKPRYRLTGGEWVEQCKT